MASTVKVYDPTKVHLVVGFTTITDFAKGSFLKIRADRADWKKWRGIDGETERSQLNGSTRLVEFLLAPGSGENDYLSSLRLAGNITGATFILALKDGNGRTLLASDTAWFEELPEDEYASDATSRTWKMIAKDGLGFLGGVRSV